MTSKVCSRNELQNTANGVASGLTYFLKSCTEISPLLAARVTAIIVNNNNNYYDWLVSMKYYKTPPISLCLHPSSVWPQTKKVNPNLSVKI